MVTPSVRDDTVNKPSPLLSVRLDGESIGEARIPVPLLLQFLSNMMTAIERAGLVLKGEPTSIRRGAIPASIRDDVALEMVQLTHGSPAAVLGFERRQAQTEIASEDIGLKVIETAIEGLGSAQSDDAQLPHGVDAGVLMAWRDAGSILDKGVKNIQFTLNHRSAPVSIAYTKTGRSRIQSRIEGPRTNLRTVEGRLLMADFKEHGTRCRIHPSVGEPYLCLFGPEAQDEVYENMLHFVRVVGEAKEDPHTGKINSIKIHDISRLEEREDEAPEGLPKGTPIPFGFWESPSLDEIAARQGVTPTTDLDALLGGWPDDIDDGFEDSIHAIRKAGVVGTSE